MSSWYLLLYAIPVAAVVGVVFGIATGWQTRRRALTLKAVNPAAHREGLRDPLKALPHWGRVAFAVQCADRSLAYLEGEARDEANSILGHAHLAAGEGRGMSDEDVLAAAVEQAVHQASAQQTSADDARYAAMSALQAAFAPATHSAPHAAQAAYCALNAACTSSLTSGQDVATAQLADLNALLERARSEGWTDSSPVSVDRLA